MTPNSTEFQPDAATYLRTHVTMAAIAMALGMVILWAVGNPHVWTGAIGGLLAVAVRGLYLRSEALAEHWTLQGGRLRGPSGRDLALADIAQVRSIGSAVQIITRSGDKHLIKFQADPAAVKARIESAISAQGQ
jgi:hypothetical protein